MSTIHLPLTASHWNIRYSPGMPIHPTTAGSSWKFSFPVDTGHHCPAADTQPPNYNQSACHHVDYVTAPYTTSILNKTSLSVTYEVTGVNPMLDYRTQFENDQTNTLGHTVRLLIEHTNDSSLRNSTYRWWSNPLHIDLDADMNQGSKTLTVSLDPSQWSDVNGQFGNTQLSGFHDALQHVGNLGMTFGGGYFFGHGLFLSSGSADFTVTDYQVD